MKLVFGVNSLLANIYGVTSLENTGGEINETQIVPRGHSPHRLRIFVGFGECPECLKTISALSAALREIFLLPI